MTSENTTPDTGLDDLLNRHFPGKVVRKDLTKLVKEGANVPVYVLEYLLGSYCASNDETLIEEGLRTVKKVLAENYVRPDEAEKVKSTIRERGSLKIIDKVTVTLNEKRDVYEALLGNLGVKGIEVPSTIVKKFREAARRRHLVHRHPGVFLRGRPEEFTVRASRIEADPDAQHGPGGVVPRAAGIHRTAVDRRPTAFDGHGADEFPGAGEVASASPDDPPGREQLQLL